jgi:fructose-1,6-bisphosphatase
MSLSTQHLPAILVDRLTPDAKSAGLDQLLAYVLGALASIGEILRAGGFSHQKAGSVNEFGDEQLEVDVQTDAVMFAALRASRLVQIASSEENPVELDLASEGFFFFCFSPSHSSRLFIIIIHQFHTSARFHPDVVIFECSQSVIGQPTISWLLGGI